MSGRVLGVIREVVLNPANDLWVAVDADGRETLVPALADLLIDVDVGARGSSSRTSRGHGAGAGQLEVGDLRQAETFRNTYRCPSRSTNPRRCHSVRILVTFSRLPPHKLARSAW